MEFVVWEEKDEERGGVRSLDVMQWRALQALRGLSARHAMRIIYTGRALCNALHRQLGPWQLQSLKLKIEHVRQESVVQQAQMRQRGAGVSKETIEVLDSKYLKKCWRVPVVNGRAGFPLATDKTVWTAVPPREGQPVYR